MLIMPAFAAIKEAGERYFPPPYLLERGAIFSVQEDYINMHSDLAVLPDLDAIASLSAWEAAKTFQLEAPNGVLGKILDAPELYPDIVMASSQGNFLEQTQYLLNLIDALLSKDESVIFRNVTERDQIISFYLDIAGIPEWKALSYDGSQYSLYLEPGYIIQ